MIFAALLLLQAVSSRETDVVMDRARREAQERRASSGVTSSVRPAERSSASTKGAASAPLAPAVAKRLQQCLDAVIADSNTGVRFADTWLLEGGTYNALQCKGFAFARRENWDQSVAMFDSAATSAEKAGAMTDAARLWGQAGNAALAGGKAETAIGYFDAALGHGVMQTLAEGEVYLDRARAGVMLGRLPAARADLDKAISLVPQDPLVWLLSATLARRMNDLTRASDDIARAVKLAGDDASVALEQGNIAVLTGDDAQARGAWQHAVALAPASPAAKAAADSLVRLSDGNPPAK